MELTATVLAVGTLATFVFGLSKTAVPAAGSFGAALLATVLPPLASTGVALPVLIVGDLLALAVYARHADPRVLARMLPAVAVGLAAGYALARTVDTDVAGRVIGALLLVSGLGELLRRHRAGKDRADRDRAGSGTGSPDDEGRTPSGDRSAASLALGAGAGLSTMLANAGGPMMTLYLLRLGVDRATFLGTVAWFFFAVNLLKVPLSVGLGLITWPSLLVSAALVPGIVAGAFVGRRLVRGMSARVFSEVALVATTLAGLWLLLG